MSTPDDEKVSSVDTKVTAKLISKGQCNFVAQIFLLKMDEKKEVVPQEVELLLDQFEEKFQEPKGLPLSRDYDHAIQLFPGTKPINLSPYRYSFEQQNTIEEIVAEMLKAQKCFSICFTGIFSIKEGF